jgi:CRP-like cAMP-binding protein
VSQAAPKAEGLETDRNMARQWLSLAGEVPERAVSAFLDAARPRAFAAGEPIVRAGEVSDELHLICQGLARYHYVTREGKDFNKNFVGEGMVAASLSSIKLGQPSPFGVEALEATRTLAVPGAFLRAALDEDGFWQRFGRVLMEGLALSRERREASLLLLSAEERYDEFMRVHGDLLERVPLYHVASYLGITPVALSRIRRRKKTLTRAAPSKPE